MLPGTGEPGRSPLTRPVLPHLSLGGASRVFLREKDRTVSRHPACSPRGHVPFCIMPRHSPLSTEGMEGTRRMLATGRTREASDRRMLATGQTQEASDRRMLTTGRTREASDGPRRPLPDLPAAGLRATPAQDAPLLPQPAWASASTKPTHPSLDAFASLPHGCCFSLSSSSTETVGSSSLGLHLW